MTTRDNLTDEQLRIVRDNDPVLSNRPGGVDLALEFQALHADVAAVETAVDALETVEADRDVIATIAVANATGGGTTAALTLDLFRRDGTTPIAAARQVMIKAKAAQYSGLAVAGSATFGSATKGSIIASGTGWCLAQTDAAGEFDCTVTNTSDETLYFAASVPDHGVSDATLSLFSCASNSDAATWSA